MITLPFLAVKLILLWWERELGERRWGGGVGDEGGGGSKEGGRREKGRQTERERKKERDTEIEQSFFQTHLSECPDLGREKRPR